MSTHYRHRTPAPWIRTLRPLCLFAAFAICIIGTSSRAELSEQVPVTPPALRPLSFDSRLLLNRLAIAGYARVEVMLLARPDAWQEAQDHVTAAGGQIRRTTRDVGYLLVDLPLERVVDVVSHASVASHFIASLGTPNWYAHAVSRSQADIARSGQHFPVTRPAAARSELPAVTASEAREPGYTADDDVGVGRWRAEHPTFDGRGVTIAFLETGLIEYGHPSLQHATTLDGRPTSKVAGVINVLRPEDDDETRVDLSEPIHALTTWHAVHGRTYLLPHAGDYRFGTFALPVVGTLVQSFAVIRDVVTGETWMDTDADADFQDERPLVDVNVAQDARVLRIPEPHALEVGFAFAPGKRVNQVHIYAALSDHHTMNVSVATAHSVPGGLASGVAPGARALVVRYLSPGAGFRAIIEGYIETAQRADVDILCDSTGVLNVPDAAGEFASIFFDRLIDAYGKPVLHSAGNAPRLMTTVSSTGAAFTVGGMLGPATFSAFVGGADLRAPVVHSLSAAGPALDGSIKPDFLVPENRISARVATSNNSTEIPRNAPTRHLPPGHAISCCTSAASPYAAGVVALLLSAAKQSGVHYSVDSLRRALTLSARFLDGWPAFQQGHGVLDVEAAWRLLQRREAPPRIVATTETSHPLTPYRALGAAGQGVFDYSGWTVGTRRTRVIHLVRHSGPAAAIRYQTELTGNDGTFSVPSDLVLPLGTSTPLPLLVRARAPGAHSVLVSLRDPATGDIVFRTQATIVVSSTRDADHSVRVAGILPLLRHGQYYIHVPEDAQAMSVELTTRHGSTAATLVAPPGLYRNYFWHVHAALGRTFASGRYVSLWPHPAPGTWSLNIENNSAEREQDRQLVSLDTAEYEATVRFLGASVQARKGDAPHTLDVEVVNRGATIREPVLEVSPATLQTSSGETPATGLPALFDIDVKPGTRTLHLQLVARDNSPHVELYLYDCSSGQCLLWDYAMPARSTHTMTVRAPASGRWRAAIATPVPSQRGRFSLEVVSATSAPFERLPLQTPLRPRERSATRVVLPATSVTDTPPAWFLEVFDAADARDALAFPWENRDPMDNLASRPVAIGSASHGTDRSRPH